MTNKPGEMKAKAFYGRINSRHERTAKVVEITPCPLILLIFSTRLRIREPTKP